MSHSPEIEQFWQAYRAALPAGAEPPEDTYEAWHFTDNREGANHLAALVLAGIKTATSSLYWEYASGEEPVPHPGSLSVVTDWDGHPLCIIQTTQVDIRPFNQVPADFAFDEGEGDRSLDYWRRVHWEVHTRTCAVLQRTPQEDMLTVCERFRVIYTPQGGAA
ncbi:MAG: ASCH domain-containing protein [Chloroflexi bacterium]|nr:ASCH domain-containing protein [Chloroflexota bacterium]